jgi:hypothetical protein
MVWEPMKVNDLRFVFEISKKVHPQLPEKVEVFEEKLKLFPAGCKKIMFNGHISGYVISYPWNINHIAPLDSFLICLPKNPDCIYIHDIALLPEARGYGMVYKFITEIMKIALYQNIHNLALVSVYDTTSLWKQYGFQIITNDTLGKKIESYGSTATYMVNPIPPGSVTT